MSTKSNVFEGHTWCGKFRESCSAGPSPGGERCATIPYRQILNTEHWTAKTKKILKKGKASRRHSPGAGCFENLVVLVRVLKEEDAPLFGTNTPQPLNTQALPGKLAWLISLDSDTQMKFWTRKMNERVQKCFYGGLAWCGRFRESRRAGPRP
jgi:hypothetical protein